MTNRADSVRETDLIPAFRYANLQTISSCENRVVRHTKPQFTERKLVTVVGDKKCNVRNDE